VSSVSNAKNTDTINLSGEEWTVRKGMRFGYTYANKSDKSERLESPHMVSLGFEMQQTMHGGEWLDILFIQNIMVSGIDQSVLAPSVNGLVGFEVNESLQIGVGVNGTIYDPSNQDHYFHLVAAVGWTQQAGKFSVPIHVVYIPDVKDYYRFAVTTGVNW
jgi:hypothetical protein